MAQPLLEVTGVQRQVDSTLLWHNLSFVARPGDIIFVRGPSGCGKTLLLRAIAGLDPLQAGSVHLEGRSPAQWGIPCWRSRVAYVHQARVNHKGTPAQLFAEAGAFHSQRKRRHGDLVGLVEQLGMPASTCQQPWSELSGGQAQRMSLAISLALQPDVLLLDEPTSACDADSVARVEGVLKRCGRTILWVTHDDQQPHRVGGQQLLVTSGALSALASSSSSGGGGGGGGAVHAEGRGGGDTMV